MKPLSQKTLQKKYEQLGLSSAKTELLHRYFLCFSNLYGVISIGEAWSVFKNYEGDNISDINIGDIFNRYFRNKAC